MDKDKKWYSNGLTAERAGELEKKYAKIRSPVYGINDRDVLALQFSLNYDSGGGTNWQLTDTEDIKALLNGTKAWEVSKLEGKVVEAYIDGQLLRGLSVNENLI